MHPSISDYANLYLCEYFVMLTSAELYTLSSVATRAFNVPDANENQAAATNILHCSVACVP